MRLPKSVTAVGLSTALLSGCSLGVEFNGGSHSDPTVTPGSEIGAVEIKHREADIMAAHDAREAAILAMQADLAAGKRSIVYFSGGCALFTDQDYGLPVLVMEPVLYPYEDDAKTSHTEVLFYVDTLAAEPTIKAGPTIWQPMDAAGNLDGSRAVKFMPAEFTGGDAHIVGIPSDRPVLQMNAYGLRADDGNVIARTVFLDPNASYNITQHC